MFGITACAKKRHSDPAKSYTAFVLLGFFSLTSIGYLAPALAGAAGDVYTANERTAPIESAAPALPQKSAQVTGHF